MTGGRTGKCWTRLAAGGWRRFVGRRFVGRRLGGGGMGGDDARKNNEQHGVGCDAARTSSCSDDGID